jgi:hypothetical protein
LAFASGGRFDWEERVGAPQWFSSCRSAFSVRRSEFGGKGEQKCVGVSAMGVSAFFNRDRPPRLFSTRTSRTITTRTIPLSQPAFDRQRSTIKIEHENEHDND